MIRSLRLLAAAALLQSHAFAAAPAETYAVPAEVWDHPRSARAMLGQPAIGEAVRAYLARPGRKLAIHYAAGQEPLLYAEELRSWLIALGIESGDIALSPDRNRGEPLTLEVRP